MADVPIHEPLVLSALCNHMIFLDLTCNGCGDESNRFQENRTNILYRFYDPTERNSLTLVANDTAIFTDELTSKTVLFHPEENIPVDTSRTYTIFVEAMNLDAVTTDEKNRQFLLQAPITITVDRRRVEDTVTLADGKTARRERLVNDFNVVDGFDASGEPVGIEDPATYCWPSWGFLPNDPIGGISWLGQAGDPETELFEGDLVIASAFAVDMDDMEVWCQPMNGCGPDNVERFPVPDTLQYAWSATAGSFIGSADGQDVAYLAPDTPGVQVTITVTITDSGIQAGDPTEDYDITFEVGEDRERYGSACVSTVSALHVRVPGPTLMAPATMADHTYDMAPYFHPRRSQFDSQQGSWGEWFYPGPVLPIEFRQHEHPWRVAVQEFKESANPDPPYSLGSFDDLEDWMKQKEFRHVFAVEGVVRRRRDAIQELIVDDQNDDLDLRVIMDEGWTPTRGASWYDRFGARMVFGLPLEDFMRGVSDPQAREIVIRDEFTSSATVELKDRFRIGNEGEVLQLFITNRKAVWIPSTLAAPFPVEPLYPLMEPTVTGDFPTHHVYGQTSPGVFRQDYSVYTPISTVEFIARGEKIKKSGI